MRILIAYRYYWPDTPPYAAMLRDMTAWFAAAGHDVEVITAQPSYNAAANMARQPREEISGRRVVRRIFLFPEHGSAVLKAVNSVLFILHVAGIILFGRRSDLVWTATMPPVVQAAVLSWAARRRGAKFLYHMQDIYPEIGVASGNLRHAHLAELLRRLDIYTLNRTDAAVVLSKDMADVLQERGVSPRRLKVINNYALASMSHAERFHRPELSGRPLRFLFTGNIGRFQHLELLIDAFAQISPEQAVLEFVGEGRAKKALMQIVADREISNIVFRPHVSVDEVFEMMLQADAGLVSLSPGIYRYAFPSKTLTYLAANLPVLALIEKQSALSRMLGNHKIGIAVDWADGPGAVVAGVEQISQAIRTGALLPEVPASLYHRDAAKAQWLALLNELSDHA